MRVIGFIVLFIIIVDFSLARIAGRADRRLEQIQGLTAEREAGAEIGN